MNPQEKLEALKKMGKMPKDELVSEEKIDVKASIREMKAGKCKIFETPEELIEDLNKSRSKPKGHLIIHEITEEEADRLIELISCDSWGLSLPVDFEADWWTQANMDKIDNAAAHAIIVRNYPEPDQPKHYGGKKQ